MSKNICHICHADVGEKKCKGSGNGKLPYTLGYYTCFNCKQDRARENAKKRKNAQSKL